MKKKDYLLIVVLYGSIIAGIFYPDLSAQISGLIKYLMMAMLFMAFLKISPADVFNALKSNWGGMIWGVVLRLVIAPALAYWVTRALYPPLAFPILLLAGASTGVTSPFFISLCRGNIAYCLLMAVMTSLLLPLSLPLMTQVLAQTALDFDLASMALFLSMVIFIPLAAAFLFRSFTSGFLNLMNKISYPLSLVLVAGINFGALGRYVPYLKAHPEQILYCAISALGLSVAFALAGWFSAKAKNWEDRVASSGSQVWINNILIIALSVHLNLPLAATLSAFYLIPLYGFVVVFSVMASRFEPTSTTN